MHDRLPSERYPRLLLRRPFLLAACIEARNRASRLLRNRVWLSTVGIILLVIPALAAWSARHSDGVHLNEALTILHTHGSWLLLLAALQSAILVTQRRRRALATLGRSWLAATPRAAATLRSSVVLNTLLTPAWQISVAVLLLLGVQVIGNADGVTVRQVMVLLIAGIVAGTAAGWLLPRRRRGSRPPGSRYIPKRRSRVEKGTAASLTGLSRWPVAHVFAWARPDNLRWPLMAALLSVMGGTPLLTGLAVVTSWMLVLYMAKLFSATVRVAREAAQWLRPTPLSLGRLAAAIIGRSFVHELVTGVLLAVLWSLK